MAAVSGLWMSAKLTPLPCLGMLVQFRLFFKDAEWKMSVKLTGVLTRNAGDILRV